MVSEARNYMDFAEHKLRGAEKLYAVGIFGSVGTNSYLAALAAARAVALNNGKKPPKTHSGLRHAFYDLIKGGLEFDADLATFLAEGRKIMYASDNYAVDDDGTHAERALNKAQLFVASAKSLCAE